VIGVGAGRAGVHGGRGEPAYLVEQVCFGVVGQVMGVGQGEVGGAPRPRRGTLASLST